MKNRFNDLTYPNHMLLSDQILFNELVELFVGNRANKVRANRGDRKLSRGFKLTLAYYRKVENL